MAILLKLLLVCGLLIVITFNFQIADSQYHAPTHQNFKFSNYTGNDVTPEMANYYKESIDLASLFFNEDISNITLWIQNRLESKYNHKYNVVIVT